MNKKESPISLNESFGQRIFDSKTNRWVKRDEAVIDPGLIRLDELEKKVIQNFFAAAEALREIKENKLYLLRADTWEKYCKERLGRSVRAVGEQLKMLEISEDENIEKESNNRHRVPKPPLIPNDLSADSVKAPMEIIRPEGHKKEIERLRKLARPQSSHKDFSSTMEAAFRKPMPETELQSTPEEDLLDEIITRIRRSKHNLNFLKALKEWLDESAIT